MVYLPHWPIPSSFGKRQIDYETVFERMSAVLEKLGNPHQKLPPVIHVTGTNGKGSATVLIAKIFSCAGYKTHIYTSPHLHECNERIVLAGEKISDAFLFEIIEEVRIAAGETPLTFMEGFTIVAFLAFAKTPADVAIIECGMGGRIDATNIIEKKLASVIMPISFDHTEYLGNSIERIAVEKAMIMRVGAPLVIASQPKQAKEIIKILAQDQGIKTYFYDEDFSILMDEETGEFDLEFFGKNKNFSFADLPKPALLGSHQYINFATAIATILAILNSQNQNFKINESDIKQAIISVYWPSRLEKVENNLNKILRTRLKSRCDEVDSVVGEEPQRRCILHTLSSGRAADCAKRPSQLEDFRQVLLNDSQSEVWIDGAHNEAGAFALARWLLEKKSEDEEKNAAKKTFIIVGFSRNKCKKEFLEKFLNIAEEIVAVRVDGEPYPEESAIIAKKAEEIGAKTFAAEDLLDAFYHISKTSANQACRVVICGSLHLARDVRKFGNQLL